MGFGIQGLGFGVWSLGSWVWGLEVGVDKISVTKGASISCLLWQAEIGLRQSWTFKVHIVGIAVSGFGGWDRCRQSCIGACAPPPSGRKYPVWGVGLRVLGIACKV